MTFLGLLAVHFLPPLTRVDDHENLLPACRHSVVVVCTALCLHVCAGTTNLCAYYAILK